jgi:hypothetical protein
MVTINIIMKFKTKIGTATGGEKQYSLRSTIPAPIANELCLKIGDELEWNLEMIDNEWVLKVNPLKK